MGAVARLKNWMARATGGHRWEQSLISDSWFEGHFKYAADEIRNSLSAHLDLSQAKLLDFGCGDGITALGVALKSECPRLTGIDITRAFKDLPTLAQSQLGLSQVPPSLDFLQVEAGKPLPIDTLDGIYSWSVFEHIDRPHLPAIVADLFRVLRPGGVAFIQIEPLYYSAFGSHLQRLIPEPWAHLKLPDEALERRVLGFEGELREEDRDLAAADGVTPAFKQWLMREYRTLNHLTANELIELFSEAGFEIIEAHRGQRPETPPDELLAQYDADLLTTNEVRLVARKSA